ncbi:hypothetical protein D3C80_609290 [compost metagenome]
MDIDRIGIAIVADQADDALRLAERIGADKMATLGKLFQRGEEFCDFGLRVRVMEDRQAEGCFGNEDITGDRFERIAGRVDAALVIARDDDAHAVLFNEDLGRAEDMACRAEHHLDAVDENLLSPCGRLFAACEILAVTDRHDVERLAGGKHMTMAGAGMIGMTMGNQRPFDGADRIDVEISDGAEQPGGGRMKQSLGFHAYQDRREPETFERWIFSRIRLQPFPLSAGLPPASSEA